jgi:type IV pilus assembly protein PilB
MVDLSTIEISQDILSLIPKEVAVSFSVIPLSADNGTVCVALPDDHDEQAVDDIAFFLGKKVIVEKFQRSVITVALQKHYGVSDIDLARAGSQNRSKQMQDSHESSIVEEDSPLTEKTDSGFYHSEITTDGSVVNMANRLITDAIRMGASDIHIEPYERFMRVRYRLDGVLHEMQQLGIEKSKPLISRLKIMSELDIAEKRRPQDGRIRVRQDGRTIDIRVSSLPTDFGEKVVLRILDKSQLQLDLSKLGFEKEDLKKFERTIKLPYGMILVTGPTGSGKTTTLYAALQHINDPKVNITTIEDPVEYNLPGINQTQVRSEIGVTFSAALRSILRQDPNIIMVGEIRDSETAEIAIRSALTGHLVFSTLHTNDAPSAVTRLIDMGVEPFLVASSLRMILAQRLLRKLCDKCKTVYEPSEAEKEEIDVKTQHVETQNVASLRGTFFKPAGCPSCNNTGYKGRAAVYEVLAVQNGFSDLISHGVRASELRKKAQEVGMNTLREAAVKKAMRGETSIEEVLRETAA